MDDNADSVLLTVEKKPWFTEYQFTWVEAAMFFIMAISEILYGSWGWATFLFLSAASTSGLTAFFRLDKTVPWTKFQKFFLVPIFVLFVVTWIVKLLHG